MTRQEYKDQLVKELKAHEIVPWLGGAFPSILKDVAEDMFIHQGRYSQELQDETRRRLIQLNDTGITDP